ncbi:MAG: hypothetical protein JXA22_03100 [Candidatus Thermoplasmatota archaeon]|nr:hypothetical protein [Candidatus Thermoplasmatota archaeon]
MDHIYTTDGGEIVGSGPTAINTAPDQKRTLALVVKVFDGSLYSAPFEFVVEVRGTPVIDGKRAPNILNRVWRDPRTIHLFFLWSLSCYSRRSFVRCYS